MLLTLFIIIFILAILFLAWKFWRDREYLQKPTKDALGGSLRKEIEEERESFFKHQARFDQAMKRAKIRRKKMGTKYDGRRTRDEGREKNRPSS